MAKRSVNPAILIPSQSAIMSTSPVIDLFLPITGIIVGLFFAAIILMFLVDLFNRPRSFEIKYEQVDGADEENPPNLPENAMDLESAPTAPPLKNRQNNSAPVR
jgi:hypothetical protein